MDAYEPYIALAVAFGVGLLIGLQREQHAAVDDSHEHTFLGGVRTFPLYALAGGIAMLVARQFDYGLWVVLAVLAVLAVPLLLAYRKDIAEERDRGLTTEVAFVIAYLLGVLALAEGVVRPFKMQMILVAGLGILVTALLSMKQPLHTLVRKVSRQEIYATLKFLVVAVIVLPLVPNETFGPLDVLNPFHVALMIVLMASISFVGYVAVRAMGPGRGLGVTGFVGGLISSTAVTLSVSGRAKRDAKLADACALAVLLASTVMLVRVFLEVGAVNAPLLAPLSGPLALMMGTGAGVAFFLYRRQHGTPALEEEGPKYRNPFELGQAFKFGALFVAVLLASKAAEVYIGTSGLYLAAVLAGVHDMDAITLSMAKLSGEGLDERVASTCILLGVMSNSVVKGGMAFVLGGGAFGRKVGLAFGAVLLAGAVGIAGLWLLF